VRIAERSAAEAAQLIADRLEVTGHVHAKGMRKPPGSRA